MKLPSCYFWLTGLFIALDSFNIQYVNAQDLSQQVVIRRTAYGVPHVTADNMLAAGFAMGYLQLEDYGLTVVEGMVKARGEWTQFHEMNVQERSLSIDRDASDKLKYARAVETFSLLKKETQDMLAGFAAGMQFAFFELMHYLFDLFLTFGSAVFCGAFFRRCHNF